jgi:hypothetical protein
MKVGRNDLCPCGSGKTFKKCHLNTPPLTAMRSAVPSGPPLPPHILRQFEEHRLREQARVAAFGHVREPVHIPNYAGYRFVAVRGRLFYSKKWKFFTDFLFEYGPIMFGQEWLEVQKSSAVADQHPLYIWRKQAYEYMQAQEPRRDGSFAAALNGPMAACNNFYYDLYTVDDNSLLDDTLLARLKHRDQFQGALHELFVEASCLRAGYQIIRENEKDPDSRQCRVCCGSQIYRAACPRRSEKQASSGGDGATRREGDFIRFPVPPSDQ